MVEKHKESLLQQIVSMELFTLNTFFYQTPTLANPFQLS